MFAPAMFTRTVFAPAMFGRNGFAPDVFNPHVFNPHVFTHPGFAPDVFAPAMFGRNGFAPDVFAPDVFAPDVFAPDVFTHPGFAPDVFNPHVFARTRFGCHGDGADVSGIAYNEMDMIGHTLEHIALDIGVFVFQFVIPMDHHIARPIQLHFAIRNIAEPARAPLATNGDEIGANPGIIISR